MADEGARAVQQPRRTINDSPTELKAKIVELCAKQDEAYRTCVLPLPADDLPAPSFFHDEWRLRADVHVNDRMYNGMAFVSARDTVRTAVDFLVGEVERAEKTDDEIAIIRLARALRPVVLERLVLRQ
ncbi:hypothetical protein JCM10213_008873 [Rhodosporidiobolus nylandii]